MYDLRLSLHYHKSTEAGLMCNERILGERARAVPRC